MKESQGITNVGIAKEVIKEYREEADKIIEELYRGNAWKDLKFLENKEYWLWRMD